MSDRSHVKTRRHMTPEQICKIIAGLNNDVFKGGLLYEDHPAGAVFSVANDETALHYWDVVYTSGGTEYTHFDCQLNTPRHFEVGNARTDFGSWIDNVICNAVALYYGGLITYDTLGDREKQKPKENYYETFEEFERMMVSLTTSKAIQRRIMALNLEHTPPEHRFAI